jgi:hypothetical protein
MSRVPEITLPLPDPLALLDATALFVIQVLLAQHPDLLAAPEQLPPTSRRPLGHAHLLFDAVRDLQYAIEVYRSCLPSPAGGDGDPDDDIPF